MAALDPGLNAALIWADGQAERIGLYALRNITAGDTLDLAREFSQLRQAAMIGTTIVGALVVAVSGTTITIPAGPNKDAAYLLVWGVHA